MGRSFTNLFGFGFGVLLAQPIDQLDEHKSQHRRYDGRDDIAQSWHGVFPRE